MTPLGQPLALQPEVDTEVSWQHYRFAASGPEPAQARRRLASVRDDVSNSMMRHLSYRGFRRRSTTCRRGPNRVKHRVTAGHLRLVSAEACATG